MEMSVNQLVLILSLNIIVNNVKLVITSSFPIIITLHDVYDKIGLDILDVQDQLRRYI